MVLLQRLNRCREAAGHLRDFGMFLRWQFVHVFVHWLTGIDLVLDAIESGHEHRRKRQVWIGRRVRRAVLDAFGLGILAIGRNTNGRRAIARAVGQVHRRLEARHQPLVGISGGTAEGAQGVRMLQKAADIIQGHLAQAGVFIAREQRLALLPE